MSKEASKSLLVIGECMMELSEDGNSYRRTFAGDTYNSAVYAKRRHNDIDVQILTAIGTDPISQAMVAQWKRDHIGHDLVMTSKHAHPGIYAISNDEDGERSFTYWRRASAATELVSLINQDIKQKIAQFNTIFFSGITLAILTDEDKSIFLGLLVDLKAQGSTIAFDPNYRAALWQDKHQARHWMNKAYALADIALPGLSDHKEVYGHQDSEQVRSFLQEIECQEIILKADDTGIFGYQRNQPTVHQNIAVEPNPKDTTGAGDSFAGTYLAERLKGSSLTDALSISAEVASLVVQHRGAIIDASLYSEAFQKGL